MHFYKFFNKIDLFFCKAKQIVYRPIIFNIFYWRTRNIFYVLLTHLHSTITMAQSDTCFSLTGNWNI